VEPHCVLVQPDVLGNLTDTQRPADERSSSSTAIRLVLASTWWWLNLVGPDVGWPSNKLADARAPATELLTLPS